MGSVMRWPRFGPPLLPLRYLYAPGAFIAVDESREVSGLVCADPVTARGLPVTR